MEYSSLLFIYAFFPLSLAAYYVVPAKFRDIVMLLLSMVFSGLFGIGFLALLMVYTLVNYICGRVCGALRGRKSRSALIPFAAGMTFDIAAVFIFRVSCFSWLTRAMHFPEGFFPIGISLFTLSAVGYLADVYTGKQKAEKNYVRFALFIMMFPRLFMGPVLRYDIFTRILRSRKCSMQELSTGFSIFIKGLAKKVIAADTLYSMYSTVKLSDVKAISAGTAWLGITAYMLCLYFTLSGVADMGVGIGYCFGFRFPQSFNYPMFSSRIRYFAAKWHVQVIHWFRKYITRPLTARVSSRYVRKLVFLLAWALLGYWYGFDLSSAVWGMLMGAAIILENRFITSKTLKATGIIYTFVLTVLFAVFLAGDSVTGSVDYLLAMLGRTHALADGLTVYLLKSYLVVMLMTMYASTDLFRNMMLRSGTARIRNTLGAISPVSMVIVLIICTALIAYTGSSEMQIIKL